MPLTAALPPHQVRIISHFDYVAVDAQRRRLYAAHTGSEALLVVNADTGAVIGQVETGAVHGIAVNSATGHVYTGDGETGTVSEVDPKAMTVVNSVDIGRPIDAIAYDPRTHRIFADEDSGTQVFVVDARSFKLTGRVPIPGHDLEYLAVDPSRPNLYQNIPDHDEYVVIDTNKLVVKKVVRTPELTKDHPLQYDEAYQEVIVGGKNGVISAYTVDGVKIGQTSMPPDVDQCTLDQTAHVLACAGGTKLWTVQIVKDAAPRLVDVVDTNHPIHTVGIDPQTHWMWTVWAGPTGDYVQAYKERP